MASFSGPEIQNTSLVFSVDATNAKNFGLSYVDVLVVGGGGGGGFEMGGGGGAGGVVYNSNFAVTPGTSYTVTVGAGGAGRTSNADNTNSAGNSVFSTITAYGGGAGGNNSYTYDGTNTSGRPMAGGSGGGSGEGQATAPGTSGQGTAGGAAIEAGYYHSGGGGGACTSGQWGQMYGAGNGGLGLAIPISGSYYGGGGAGGSYAPGNPIRAAAGGTGGGGNANLGAAGSNGGANTGGGGGGGSYSPSSVGGNGGSGIVIVKYVGPQRATGGTVTTSGNYTIHTFTTSGTFVPLSIPSNSGAITALADLTGRNNTAVSSGSPTFNTSNNSFIDFNGSTQYFDLGSSLSSILGTSVTVCAYAKISSVVSKNCLFSINGAYNFFLPGNRLTTTYQLYWDSASSWKNGNTSSWTTGQWYHFAWTISGTTLTFYVNGVADGSVSIAGTLSPTGSCRIGFSNAGEYLTGSLSTLSVYSSALSASDINSLFQASRDRYGV